MNKETLYFVAPLLVFCLASCGGDDPPIGHIPAEDYVVYFSSASYGDSYFTYHTATGALDSVRLPYSHFDGMAVAPDGKHLYLSDHDSTVVLEADSFTVHAVLHSPTRSACVASPNGRFVAVCGDDLNIFETSGNTIVFSDTDRVSGGAFSQDGQRFYGAAGWTTDAPVPPYAYVANLSAPTSEVVRKQFDDGGVWLLEPSPDEQTWFTLIKFGTFDYIFEVYDAPTDSVIFRRLVTPGSGDIEITPDGRFAFYTNPGTIMTGPPAAPYVYVYETARNEIVDSILIPSPDNTYMLPRLLAVTPDGSTLVAAGARGQGEFSVIDLIRREEVDHHDLGNTEDIWGIACQSER